MTDKQMARAYRTDRYFERTAREVAIGLRHLADMKRFQRRRGIYPDTLAKDDALKLAVLLEADADHVVAVWD